MKEIALGQLLYTPDRFGLMRAGDFQDALQGFIKGKNQRFMGIAELIRKSTTILWNKQIGRENVLSAQQLWPFPWENREAEAAPSEAEIEERNRIYDAQAEFLLKRDINI